VGCRAGNFSQGGSTVAIGDYAGEQQQRGGVAVGSQAGRYYQGDGAVAVGGLAGTGTQGNLAIAIGSETGRYAQGTGAIAIGYLADGGTQGVRAIAIGSSAVGGNQAAGSIVLNASGSSIAATQTSTYIRPIRSVTDVTGFKQLYFNPTTFELVYYNV
jgi:hypothetical protein